MFDIYWNCTLEDSGSMTEIASIAIALIAIYIGVRYSLTTFIHSLMFEKAKDANHALNSYNLWNFQQVSAMVSAIVVSFQLYHIHTSGIRYLFLIFMRQQRFSDSFYLQLNTTIRIMLERESKFDSNNIQNFNGYDSKAQSDLNDQWVICKRLLNKSIERANKGKFKVL